MSQIKTCKYCLSMPVCTEFKLLNSKVNDFALGIQMNMDRLKLFREGQFLLLADGCDNYFNTEETKNAAGS